MTTPEQTIDVIVSHRGTAYPLSLLPDTTMDVLASQLQELTTVPVENQKLLYKGKKAVGPDETVVAAGMKGGMKIQVLGATAQELEEMKDVENEYQRRERILKERAAKPQAKVRQSYCRPLYSTNKR